MKFINTNYTTTVVVVDMVDERNINVESFLRICIYHVDIMSLFHCCRESRRKGAIIFIYRTRRLSSCVTQFQRKTSPSLAFSLFYFMSTLEPYWLLNQWKILQCWWMIIMLSSETNLFAVAVVVADLSQRVCKWWKIDKNSLSLANEINEKKKRCCRLSSLISTHMSGGSFPPPMCM